jgi:hypothetical protein
MQPLRVLQQIAANLDRLDDPQDVHRAMDEVEFVFDLLPPELQDQADDLMQRLRRRLQTLQA